MSTFIPCPECFGFMGGRHAAECSVYAEINKKGLGVVAMYISDFQTKHVSKCNARLRFGRYPNGNRALQVFDAEDASPLVTASINPPLVLGHDEIAVKNWTENEGVKDALVKAGIIDAEVILTVPSGYVEMTIHKLTDVVMKKLRDK